jgi:hypothetical protein
MSKMIVENKSNNASNLSAIPDKLVEELQRRLEAASSNKGNG